MSRAIHLGWGVKETAFKRRLLTGVITNKAGFKDPGEFLEEAYCIFEDRIRKQLEICCLKVNIALKAIYIKTSGNEEQIFHFNSRNRVISAASNLPNIYQSMGQRILKQMEELEMRGSDWTLKEIIGLDLNINKYEPFAAGAALRPLPKWLENKNACVNIDNGDNMCFAWAVGAALYPVKQNPQRASKYRHPSTVLNLDKIAFPMTLDQIPIFEELNGVSVNVYGARSGEEWATFKDTKKVWEIVPIHITEEERGRHVNLLMIEKERVEDKVLYHFVWIKSMSRLLASQVSGHGKMYYCNRCLCKFYTIPKLDEHRGYCNKLEAVKSIFPSDENKWVQFKNLKNKEFVPYVVYADLETFPVPLDTCYPDEIASSTTIYQQHLVNSVAYYLHCAYNPALSRASIRRGPDALEWFRKEMEQIVVEYAKILNNPLPMSDLTEEEHFSVSRATKCHICGQLLGEQRIMDHCHLTGKFRGLSHPQCNLMYQIPSYVPVVFHNLKNFDSHFLIREFAEGNTKIIPDNMEKYKAIFKRYNTYHEDGHKVVSLRFIDSMQFMASSLDKLVGSIPKDNVKIVRQLVKNEEQLALVLRKGTFPYEYANSWERLEEASLPPKEAFYSTLKGEGITEADYQHAQNVWKAFNINTLGEYLELYLKVDTLLLGDVFENFRMLCSNIYKLDPGHYITAPSLGWDAMLKSTGVKLELLQDVDMYQMVEAGIRGGLACCMKRYARANNKYFPENYNVHEPERYLLHTDVNNQYGWAMMESLPREGFKWMKKMPTEEEILGWPDDSSIGAILEVDLEYPKELHDEHKDLPLCFEKQTAPGGGEEKLMATVCNKEKYVVHYRMLKKALELGLKLTKVHRTIQFEQSKWMAKYIINNTQQRAKASSAFEKDFFKLMNNAVFGKSMQNVRKMRDIRLVTKWEGRNGAGRLIAMPNFNRRIIFDENMSAVEMSRVKVMFDKPIYVGQAVLDISKLTLFDFHYGFMKPNVEKCSILYTDTDSLLYEIEGQDIYELIRKNCAQHFDTSDYPSINVYEIPHVNKKVPGKMKDEDNGRVFTEFVGLRAKQYAKCIEGQDMIKKSKGVQRRDLERQTTFEDYMQCLKKGTRKMVVQHMIRSARHRVYGEKNVKVALSRDDDKRYQIPDSVETLPWGHYAIE